MDIKKEIETVFKELGLQETNHGSFSGKWHSGGKRDIYTSYSPIDGTALGKVELSTKDDYEEIMAHLQTSYSKWSEVPGPKRGFVIKEIGDELLRKKSLLGKIVSLETGKTQVEGEGEIQEMIDIAYFATGVSRQLYGLTMTSERPEHRLSEQWIPMGIVGVISAFNFPSAVWSWNSFIAAVCGDVVIWKPSTKASLVAIAVIHVIEKVLERLEMPQIFSLIVSRGSQGGEWIATDHRIPLVSFTGSIPVGKKINTTVSARLGKTILELGGNNAAIISSRANMEIALKGLVFGSLATAGQRCTSTRRAIIHEDIYDEFVKKLKAAYSTIKIGNPLEKGVLVGPLIDREAVQTYLDAIETAKKEGGKLLYGGEEITIPGLDHGFYVKPAIVEANRSMPIVKEETFGPLLYVFRYKTIEEAISIHNSVPQGLSSAIFTTDLSEEHLFLSARGSDCGIVNVNTSTAGAEIGGAFGGEKETGSGRESGSDAWKAYMRRQTVTVNWGRDIPLSQGVRFDF